MLRRTLGNNSKGDDQVSPPPHAHPQDCDHPPHLMEVGTPHPPNGSPSSHIKVRHLTSGPRHPLGVKTHRGRRSRIGLPMQGGQQGALPRPIQPHQQHIHPTPLATLPAVPNQVPKKPKHFPLSLSRPPHTFAGHMHLGTVGRRQRVFWRCTRVGYGCCACACNRYQSKRPCAVCVPPNRTWYIF